MVWTRENLKDLPEKDLCLEVLIPLFQAMGYKAVRFYHGGPLEQGKDIVMWKLDELQQRIYYAVVVKAERITGSVSTSSVVAFQALQALGSTFVDEVSQEEHSVREVWIITSREITKEGHEALKNALAATRANQLIRKIDGEKLWELVERYIQHKSPPLGLLPPNPTTEQVEPLRGLIPGNTGGLAPPREVIRTQQVLGLNPPATLRYLLDQVAPGFHSFLTQHGVLSSPAELYDIREYLTHLKVDFKKKIQRRTSLPLYTRIAPQGPVGRRSRDPFVRPIKLTIREMPEEAEGGDSASSHAALVDPKSKPIKNIVRTLLASGSPLVLLGDPGSGKTMTLQETAVALASSERRRIFPSVTLYVHLGEFHVEGKVDAADVLDYVKKKSLPCIQPWIERLDKVGRLVVLFDGMDEMSRNRYSEHTEALIWFANSRSARGGRTLFSCRFTDFNPAFRRLGLLPFDRSQIAHYLREAFLPEKSVEIEGKDWKMPDLAREIKLGKRLIDAANPLILSLLCFFLKEERVWPQSRVQLLDFLLDKTYEQKRREAEEEKGINLPPTNAVMREWARIAFTITERDRGPAISLKELIDTEVDSDEAEWVLTIVRAGQGCGVLMELIPEEEHLIQFSHYSFQEYLTALWISDTKLLINWLDKVDAPRWQETMVNLVLMGRSEEIMFALAEAIEAMLPFPAPEVKQFYRDSKDHAEKELHCYMHGEATLADRIELGSRLVRYGIQTSTVVKERLLPSVQAVAAVLIEHGTPITQVKMVRTFHNLGSEDLLKSIDRPLHSPVRWVREQALALLATQPKSWTAQADLTEELGTALASDQLLPGFWVFANAATESKSWRVWAAFLLGIFLSLAERSIFIAGGWALFDFSMRLLPYLNIQNLQEVLQLIKSSPLTLPFIFVFLVSGGATELKRRSFTSGVFGLGLAILCLSLWQGDWYGVPLFVGMIFVSVTLRPLLLGITFLVHLAALFPYPLFLWKQKRNFRSSFMSLLNTAWATYDLRKSIRHWYSEDLPEAGGVLAAVFGYWAVRSIVISKLPFPFDEVIVLIVFTILSVVVGFGFIYLVALAKAIYRDGFKTVKKEILVSFTETQQPSPRPKKEPAIKGVLQFALVIGGVFCACEILAILQNKIEYLQDYDKWIARFFSIAIPLLILGLLIWVTGRSMRLTLTKRLPRSKRSLTIGDWRSAIILGDPQEQENLLLWVASIDPQRIGLKNQSDVLVLLVEMEEFLKYDPARSAYWELRNRLEQGLRQERKG